jgi:cation diffusion facilitator CzcD-associated flavoprotein CzcO
LRAVIIGAGVSGIVTARVLDAMGVDVVVYEQRSDIGGVWSATRAYPDISTQDDRLSYAFSDFPFPDSVSEHPTGAEVRAYLESYAQAHGLTDRVRLSTRVESAHPLADGTGWTVRALGPQGVEEVQADWLVAANGVFSTPHVPHWPGRDAFERAGGRVVVPSDVGDGRMLDDARVLVVGWGKTACDLSAVAARRAASTRVVARTITWKYPKDLGLGGLTFRHLVLTRAGERIIGGAYRSPSGKVLLSRIPERFPRKLVGRVIARAIDRRTGLTGLGLRPVVDVSASTSLVTAGFFEGVRDGSIVVHREQTVTDLAVDDGVPTAVLADGTRIPADVVIAATGYEQRLDFLPEEVTRPALARAGGRLRLYRRILAIDVPRLAFIGWAHSYRSPLTSELAAIWLGAHLTGRLHLPESAEAARAAALFPVGGPAGQPGAKTHLPGVSLRDLDELLDDLGVPLTRAQRAKQRFGVLDPVVYASVLPALIGAAAVVQEVMAL